MYDACFEDVYVVLCAARSQQYYDEYLRPDTLKLEADQSSITTYNSDQGELLRRYFAMVGSVPRSNDEPSSEYTQNVWI